MKTFSDTFKSALREDRQLNAIISYKTDKAFYVLTTQDDKDLLTENDDILITQQGFLEYDKEAINSVNPLYNVSLLKTTCKSVQIDSNNKIAKGTWVNVKIGVYKEDTQNYEYLDFGNYYVNEEPTYQADSNSYLITAYDKMIESMVNYDDNPLSITYPIFHKNFVMAICNKLGWSYDLIDYPNYNKDVSKDLYTGQNLTYRDILDDLNGACGGSFMFNLENKLIWKRPTETNQIVEDNDLKNVNVDFGEKYGKVNVLTITTNGNVVLGSKQDETSIEENGKTEFNINDNYILNYSTEDFIDGLFNEINGLEYCLYDIDSTGLLIFEPLDIFTFRHNGVDYKTIMFNDDIKLTQGLVETTFAEKPEETEKDYTTTDKDKNKLNNAIISLDKANAEIVLKVTSDGKLSQVRLDGNASDGSIFEIKSDNIKLEGYTTINGGFQVDLEGNVICNNAIIKGSEVILSDNTEIIGGNGLLTNLQFQSTNVKWLNKLPGSYFLGYNYAYSTGAFKNWLEIDCIVPKDFKITEAYVNVYHTPVNWDGTRGYCRNLKLYKVLSPLNANINGAYLSEYEATYNYIENNTNALNFTANGTSSGEIATSSDIKNLLDVGFNKFTIHTSDSVPSVSADDNLNQKLGAYTGYCYAVVNIIGFKK